MEVEYQSTYLQDIHKHMYKKKVIYFRRRHDQTHEFILHPYLQSSNLNTTHANLRQQTPNLQSRVEKNKKEIKVSYDAFTCRQIISILRLIYTNNVIFTLSTKR